MSAKHNQKIVVLLNDASLSRNEINDWLGDVYFKKKYKASAKCPIKKYSSNKTKNPFYFLKTIYAINIKKI